MVNTLSFPGLGIGEFDINPVAFTILGKDIMWYGIIITLGMIAGFSVALRHAKIEGIKTDDVLDLAIYGIVFSIIGARAYYVITDGIEKYDTFIDMIAIWNGGLAIYGGLIAGLTTAFIVCKIKKLSYAKTVDMAALGIMIGQVIGRWGNFVNAEAHGGETSLPWRMGINNAYNPITIYVHPTFLYESLWNLLGFILISIFYKHKKFDGQIFLMQMSWYGFGRMFIESLRTDSLYIFDVIRVSQLVGFLAFVVGVTLIIINLILRRNKKNGSDN